MENIKFLATYNDDSVVIEVQSNDQIVTALQQKFNLPANCLVKLKVFDKDWDEWVNKQPSEICDKDRVKVKTEQPSATLGNALHWANLPSWEVQIDASQTHLTQSAGFSNVNGNSQLEDGELMSVLSDDSASETSSLSVSNHTAITPFPTPCDVKSICEKSATGSAYTASSTSQDDTQLAFKRPGSPKKETGSVPDRLVVTV